MDILFLLWFFILPIVGILTPIFALIFWFFIVPGVAKMLTFARFRNVSIHAVADASGFVELVPTKEHLPEGIVRTKHGWHFLPRPINPPGNPGKKTNANQDAERIALKTHILKTVGKPFLLNYAGKITSMNYSTLAALQQNEARLDLKWYFEELETVLKDLPKHFRKELEKKLAQLKEAAHAEKVTIINPEAIQDTINKMYPPSLIDALAINREMKGMKRRGREMLPLILGGAIIIGIVVIGVVAIIVLGQPPA